MIVNIILGLLSGVIFGLTGSGGGILATPFLIYGAGLPIHEAIGITLLTLSFTGIVGVVKSLHHKRLDLTAAYVICITGLAGSTIGSAVNPHVPARGLTIAFASILLIIASLVWYNAHRHHLEERAFNKVGYYFRLLAIGLVTGLLNGLLGISGGVIIVTSLMFFLALPLKKAASISIFVVAVISIISSIGHFFFSTAPFNYEIAIAFVASSAVGMFFSMHYAEIIPDKFAKKSLAIIIFLMSIFMFVRLFLLQ